MTGELIDDAVVGLTVLAPGCDCTVEFSWPAQTSERAVTMRALCPHRPWRLTVELAEGRWPLAGRPPYALPADRLAAPCWCGRTMLSVPAELVRAGQTGTCGLDRCTEQGTP